MIENKTSDIQNTKGNLRSFTIVFAVALILRLILFLYNLPYTPLKYYADSDAYNYENIAVNIAHNGVYSNELQPPYLADIHRPPVYPYYLAIFYALGNGAQSMSVLGLTLIGALTVGLTFLLMRAFQYSKGEAIFAALLVAFNPQSILFTNLLMSETIFTFFLVAGSLNLVLYFRTLQMRWLILSGVTFGLAALTRPIGEYLPLALFVLFVVIAPSSKRQTTLKHGVLFVAISSAIILGWVYRNYTASGVWTLSDTGSSNLVYNSTTAVLAKAENLSEQEAINEVQRMIDTYGKLSPTELMKAENQVALQVFEKYPVQTVSVHIEGLIRVLVNPGLEVICAQLSRVNEIGGCKTPENMSSLGIIEQTKMKLGAMDGVQLAVTSLEILCLLVMYFFAGFGIFELIRNRQWLILISVIMVIFYMLFVSMAAQPTSRLRIPLIPYWSVLAGIGFGKITRLAQRKSNKQLIGNS